MGQQDSDEERNILTEISDNDYDPFGAYDDEGQLVINYIYFMSTYYSFYYYLISLGSGGILGQDSQPGQEPHSESKHGLRTRVCHVL